MKKNIESSYKELLESRDFENLELLIKKPNIFRALGIEKYEIRHSQFLAWLLNPKETHGLGGVFLIRFLRELFIDNRSGEISIIDIPKLKLEEALVKREWRNIDILIELSEVIIIVENKLFSTEHSNQLKRYKEIIHETYPDKKTVFVYLNPGGHESTLNSHYINLSYEAISNILEGILIYMKESINPAVYIYVSDYNNTIKQKIMESSETNEIAKRIYKNHKELLDIIFENRPDAYTEFRDLLENRIIEKGWIIGTKGKGYVRFLSNELNPIIPKGYSKGWTLKESFLYEISFINTGKDTVRIYATIDGTDTEAAEILKPILDKIEGKECTNDKWFCYQNLYQKTNITELMNSDTEKIEVIINNIIQKAQLNVDKIDKAILEKKDELNQLNEGRRKK
ncbi:MAG: PD-(D/E)XK nuclease family protein [Bacteroidia bacterium]|nr:PD-(D/E)XK nuclease family protein [Bacteroidia bacterium]